MKQVRITLIVVAAIIMFSGCSKDYKCEVRSNTDWSGAFGDRTVDGSGNRTIDMPGDPPQCVAVQKQTEEGYLEVQMVEEASGPLNSENDYSPVRTTAAYGVVTACTKD